MNYLWAINKMGNIPYLLMVKNGNYFEYGPDKILIEIRDKDVKDIVGIYSHKKTRQNINIICLDNKAITINSAKRYYNYAKKYIDARRLIMKDCGL
jgi:hypothetical protein